jgi:transcriptional regulator with XRE-family HTH domain
MNLGNAVKELRKKRGLTQGNFCEEIGITQSYLSQVEKGHKEPSIDVLKKIADALGTPMPVLFWFTLTEEDVIRCLPSKELQRTREWEGVKYSTFEDWFYANCV